MIKKIKATLFFCVIILTFSELLYAGNLDRQVVQPRTNDATKSMIRVPGVIGQSQAYAMSALQQAGLGVSVLEAKELPKEMKGAANMEGKVVSQTPAPGGMAMYGTSVSIYIWKPKETSSTEGSENSSGASGWGSNEYSSYDQTQSTYSGTQAQPQMYQQQMGTTGTTATQGSQPFQVQQYYYPSTGTGSTDQQNQTDQGQQSYDPNAYQQPADPNVSQPPADANTSQQTGNSEETGTSEQTPEEQQQTTPAQ